MLGSQIPMPLADLALAGARLKRRRVSYDKNMSEALERLDPLDLAALIDIGQQLVDVALELTLGGRGRAYGSLALAARARGIRPTVVPELRPERGSALHARAWTRPCPPRCSDAFPRGNRPPGDPHHRPAQRRHRSASPRARRGTDQAPTGDSGALLPAHLPPLLRRPVVQEVENQRLLQLVGKLLSQEHPRDVRFAHFDRTGTVRIGGRDAPGRRGCARSAARFEPLRLLPAPFRLYPVTETSASAPRPASASAATPTTPARRGSTSSGQVACRTR